MQVEMGSEGETVDFNSLIYVAVGRNVKEGKSLLTWALENFEGRNICLLHVHQPANFVSLLNGKLSASSLKNSAIKACQEFERLKMQKLINQYLLFLSQMGVDKVWTEIRNIDKGILQLIDQHRVRRLVMGAAAETFTPKKLSDANSTKAMVVYEQAPLSCHIWFISKGSLVFERPEGFGSHLITDVQLLPSINGGKTALTSDLKGSMDVNAEVVKDFWHSTRLIEEVVSSANPSSVAIGQTIGDNSPLFANVVCLEHLPSSLSNTYQDSEEKESHIYDKLEHSMADTENFKHRAFRESLRCRAEEDALEALHKAEAAENVFKEEISRRKEIEEQLLIQRQELETMKYQHNQCVKELKLIHDQKPALESQLRESYCSEKELEDKIVQAVNLLITFKGKRDQLQMEYDSTIRKINKYRALKTEDPSRISPTHFFGISFSDIIEATQNFDPSHKIGEGRYGSVFKGIFSHIKVAIKMLLSSGSQSDSEFKNEVEVLSRVRHPNLVTLVGACPESRSLIYEYIDNGSLEDYLSTPAKTSSLPWQIRIRIASDTCSALMFLHASCNVHGNLKPSNILLNANFVAKISDFGICNLISQNENYLSLHPEKLTYVDPEFSENGDLTAESDVYSFGIILLKLLTARPVSGVIRDVKCSLERGNLDGILDTSAGDWPLEQAKQLFDLALRCCERDPVDRPDLSLEVWTALDPMTDLCSISSCVDSGSQRKIPSHFVCPIFQEVMKDPHIAGDGFTYEGDAIKGWFNSGHKTSPMTNLKLDNCDLLPNYALYYAIQEWQHNT